MPPPLLRPIKPITISVEPLTPPAFSSFGTAVSFPLSPSTQSSPASSRPLVSNYPNHQPSYTIANQSTALKFAPISPLTNNYHNAPSAKGEALMSMFACFPRKNIQNGRFEVKILERHPFTTQTFSPLGLNPIDEGTCYLVIVAPTLRGTTAEAGTDVGEKITIRNPPDLSKIRAFAAKGNQAVTYSPGTWHAPMVVLGQKRVDFVVTQFVSGVADEDCQEVRVGEAVDVGISKLMHGSGGIQAML